MGNFSASPTYLCKRNANDECWVVFECWEPQRGRATENIIRKIYCEKGDIDKPFWNGHNWELTFTSRSLGIGIYENDDNVFWLSDYKTKKEPMDLARKLAKEMR